MLATLVDKSFHLPGWIYEEKYDGIRILAYKEGTHVSLITRNNIERTERYPEVAAAVGKLKPQTLLLDGEVVVFDKQNVSHFQLLQNALRHEAKLQYCAFDLIFQNGEDLRGLPLLERKERLKSIRPSTS